MASRLDCCGRCEVEENPENTELGRHVDACTKCEGTGGLSTVDGAQVLQCTRQGVDGHETVQTGSNCECESVLAWLRARVEFTWCIPAMHVTCLLGLVVPASYDEYTALVKSGNVASEHVRRAISGTYHRW